jgi:hypothetical protein
MRLGSRDMYGEPRCGSALLHCLLTIRAQNLELAISIEFRGKLSSLIVSVFLAVCKSGEVTRDWRILHNEELHNLYFHHVLLYDKIKWAGHVASMEKKRRDS